MKLWAFIIGLLVVLVVLRESRAQDNTTAQIAWPIPTLYPDGVAMPASDIDHVTIHWLIEGTTAGGTITTPISPPVLQIPTPCGKYVFSGSFTTNATAHVPSSTSNTATATWDTGVLCPVPLPPGAVVVI